MAENPHITDFLSEQTVLNPHQYPEWGEFQKAVGSEFFRLGSENTAGELIAYAQIFLRHLPFGYTWLHVPRGPVVKQLQIKSDELRVADLFAEIKQLGKQKKAVFVRFDFPENFDVALISKAYNLSPSHQTNFPDTTLILDLTKTEEELLAEMKPKGRYNIRVAEKHGVTARETTDPAAAEIFYNLLQKTTARDGFSAHPKSYYGKFLEMLGSQGRASCFLAEKDGQPIAASLVTYFGSVATYYYGASDHAHRHLMAPYLLQWRAIRAAKIRGLKTYDFLGIAPEGAEKHHLTGVTDFKRKFGGTVVNYPASSELVLKPGIYSLFRLGKKILQRS